MTTNDDIERAGELLLEEGIVTLEEMEPAAREPGQRGDLARAILASCPIRRSELTVFLAVDFQVPQIDLGRYRTSAEALARVPADMARKHLLVPLDVIGDVLCVAKSNFFNRAAVRDLRKATGLRVKVLQAEERAIEEALARLYGGPSPAPLPPPPKPRSEPAQAVVEEGVEEVPTATEGPAGISDVIHMSRGEVVTAAPVDAAEFQTAMALSGHAVIAQWERLYTTAGPLAAVRVSV